MASMTPSVQVPQVLAIASHIPTVQIGQTYFQETHPDRLFNECSVYNEMVSHRCAVPARS